MQDERIHARDVLGIPILKGDRLAIIKTTGSSKAFTFGIAVDDANGGRVKTLRDGETRHTYKDCSKVLVITHQHEANMNNYPEYFI